MTKKIRIRLLLEKKISKRKRKLNKKIIIHPNIPKYTKRINKQFVFYVMFSYNTSSIKYCLAMKVLYKKLLNKNNNSKKTKTYEKKKNL